MAGFGIDTNTLRISVELPDGSHVDVEGVNDGVNGYSWSAHLALPDDPGAVSLPVKVTNEVLIDGINPLVDEDDDDDEPTQYAKVRATCSKCGARTYRQEECVCGDEGDAEDYDEALADELGA